MGVRPFSGRFLAIIALLTGGAGCGERLRPLPVDPGNGIGPVSTVLTPGELDTVHLDTLFALDVRVVDSDGIDSIWVTLEPNVNTLSRIGADGATSQTVGFSVLMPESMSEETLYVHAQGLDVLGDSGAVFTRRLLIQP